MQCTIDWNDRIWYCSNTCSPWLQRSQSCQHQTVLGDSTHGTWHISNLIAVSTRPYVMQSTRGVVVNDDAVQDVHVAQHAGTEWCYRRNATPTGVCCTSSQRGQLYWAVIAVNCMEPPGALYTNLIRKPAPDTQISLKLKLWANSGCRNVHRQGTKPCGSQCPDLPLFQRLKFCHASNLQKLEKVNILHIYKCTTQCSTIIHNAVWS